MKTAIWNLSILLAVCSVFPMHGKDGLRPRGDVNCDWAVTIADVNAIIEAILNGTPYQAFYTYALDVNGDHAINIADLNAVVGAIMGDKLPSMPTYSGTLPVLFIITEGKRNIVGKEKEDYMHADWWLDAMGINGYESIGSAEQPLGMLIKGHGNYTWNYCDKKSLRLKLNEKQPLMGMHSNRHFVLLAHSDDYLARLKNTMGFELSRRIGLSYTPAQEPVEVVLNGQYIGLYFLTEKIRVSKHRVNIEEQADGETDTDKITGGWLLEIDNSPKEGEYVYITEKPGSSEWHDMMTVSYRSPEILSDEQKQWLVQYLNDVNSAIYTTNKNSTEWEQYIDIDTLAMYYIVGEIMDDLEYFAGSCFMYKRHGDDTKLIFGPVWDFGNSFQRWAIYGDTDFNKFIYQQPTEFVSHWIEEIYKFPRFRKAVREHWRDFYNSGFNGLDIDQYIDDFVNSIKPAFYAETVRWPQYDIIYQKTDFSLFIHRKINWLQSQWGDGI